MNDSGSPSLLKFENELSAQYRHIAGLDEAGRGAWAGPVCAAAVIFPRGLVIQGVCDSKLLTSERREKLFDEICAHAVSFGVGLVSPDIIDQINILQATKLAMLQAIKAMSTRPDFLIIDGKGMELDIDLPQRSIIDGDALSHSIAAASILAKVTRDRILCALDQEFPGYEFASHKGYGTAIHRQCLRDKGVTPIHRKTYKPIQNLLRNS